MQAKRCLPTKWNTHLHRCVFASCATYTNSRCSRPMCGVAAGLSRPSKHLIRLAFIMRSSPHNVGHHESRFPSLGIRPLVPWARLMSESGRICLPAYEPVPSNYAWRLQSIGAIALSIEVPLIFDRPDPHALCVHEVFFKAQSCRRWLTFQRQFLMSAIPPIATKYCSAAK